MKNIIKFSFLFLLIGVPMFSSCNDEKKEEELAVLVDQYQKEREEARKTVDGLENLYAKEKDYYYVKINVCKTPSDIKELVAEAEKDNALIAKIKRKYYIQLDELEHLAPDERLEYNKMLDDALDLTAISSLMINAEELSAKYIYLNEQLLERSNFKKADGSGILPIAEHKNKFTREELNLVVDVKTEILSETVKKGLEKHGFFDPAYSPNIVKAVIYKNTTKPDVDISSCKKLKSVKIDGISSITIGSLPELESFDSNSEKISSIDLSACPNLKQLRLEDVSSLVDLKFPEAENLERINLFRCSSLKKQLEINRFKNLRFFAFVQYDKNSTKLQDPNLWDFSTMELLEAFYIGGVGQKLEQLKFSSKATKLRKIKIEESNVGILDCGNTSSLKYLEIRDSEVQRVILPDDGMLEEILLVNSSGLTNLDFSRQKNLKKIFIRDDKQKIFTSLMGTINLGSLETATFDCPVLTDLDLSNSKKIRRLVIYKGTKLTLPEGKIDEKGFKLIYKDKK